MLNNIYAVAEHPITSANPEWIFKVKEMKVERGKLYARGEDTIWFSSELCKFYNEGEGKALIAELEDHKRIRKELSNTK